MSLRLKMNVVAAAGFAALVTAACGAASHPVAPTASVPWGQSVSTAVSQPTSGGQAAPAPMSVPATAAAGGQAAASAPAALAGDAVVLALDPSSSKASYHAHEQLVGRNLPSDAVGTTTAVSGSIVLTTDGQVAPDQSKISVDLSKLTSDESRRDNFIKGETLQTGRYPMATFVPRAVDGLPNPLPTSGDASFQMSGDLTVHNVTRPVTWQVTAQFAGSQVTGSATTNVKITDFGMTPPKAGPVLSIDNGLGLELAFSAARQA